MLDQYATIQAGALGSFRDLTRAMVTDGAMQHFLSVVNSSKEEPNENFARELLELFTLGANNGYTEEDIREAARAFTGYTYDFEAQEFGWEGASHDRGQKTILGRRGPFTPIEVVDIAIDDPRHPEFICTKLWAVSLAAPGLRRASWGAWPRLYVDSGTPHRPGAAPDPHQRRVLRGPRRAGHDQAAVRVCRGHAPSLRAGRADDPDLVARLDRMGQLPFYPPNVSGLGIGHGLAVVERAARALRPRPAGVRGHR